MPRPNVYQVLRDPRFRALSEQAQRTVLESVSPEISIEEKIRLYGDQSLLPIAGLQPHQLSQRALEGSGLSPSPAGAPPDPDIQGMEVPALPPTGQLILGSPEEPTFGGFLAGFDLPGSERQRGFPDPETGKKSEEGFGAGDVLHGLSLPLLNLQTLTPERGAQRGLAAEVSEFTSPLAIGAIAAGGGLVNLVSSGFKKAAVQKLASLGFGGVMSYEAIQRSPELWDQFQKSMKTDDPQDWAIFREQATRFGVEAGLGAAMLRAGTKGISITRAPKGGAASAEPAGLLEAPRGQLEAGAIRMPGRQALPPPVDRRFMDLKGTPGEGALVPFRKPGSTQRGSPLPPMLRQEGRLPARFAGEGPALLERGAIRLGPGKAAAEAVSRETSAGEQAAIEFGDPSRDLAAPGQYRARELGSVATVRAGKEKLPVNYALVSNAEIVASHSQNLSENPNFPQNLQPRRRESKISDAQISEIASNYDPEQVAESYLAGDGAPIVGPDMLVEGGNARTLGLRRAYGRELPSAQRYKEWLTENAERFGFSPEAVAAIDDPQLVRLRSTLDPTFDRERFVQDLNTPERAVMSPTEIALQDSSRVTDGMLDLFKTDIEGDPLLSAKNRDFVRAFVDQAVPETQRADVMTSAGQLSSGGVSRIRNAVFAKAYKDPLALERMAESLDDASRNVTQALLQAAPSMVKVDQGISKGVVFDRSISADVAKASGLSGELRRRGLTPDDYLNQTVLFGDSSVSAVQKGVLKFIERNSRSAKKIGDVLKEYNRLLVGAGNPNQQGIFGALEPPSKLDLWKRATSTVQQDVQRQARAGQEDLSVLSLLKLGRPDDTIWFESVDAIYKPPYGKRKKGILYVNYAAMGLLGESGGAPPFGVHLGPGPTMKVIHGLQEVLKPGPGGESLVRGAHGEKAEESVRMLLAQVRQASADGATMIAVDYDNSLSQVKGTVRHERIHAATSRIRRQTGIQRLVDPSKMLDNPAVLRATKKLLKEGYPYDNDILIDEIAARVIGGGPEQSAELGMSEAAAERFAMDWVVEVVENAGADALKLIDTAHPARRSVIDARLEFAERLSPHRKQAEQLGLFRAGQRDPSRQSLPERRPGGGSPGVPEDVQAFRPLEELPKLIASEGGFLNVERVIAAIRKLASEPRTPKEAGYEVVRGPLTKHLVPILNNLQSPSQKFKRIHRPVGQLVNKAIKAEQNVDHQTRVNEARARRIFRSIPKSQRPALIDLLDSPGVDIDNIPAGTSPKMEQAYRDLRGMFDEYRQRIIATKRAMGEEVPDDWGFTKGYYAHVFEGDWGVYFRGRPIDSLNGKGPFTRSFKEAATLADSYLQANPAAAGEVQVKLFNPAFTGDPRVRMTKAQIFKFMGSLRKEGMDADEAWELAFGVARTGAQKRKFGSVKARKANLPGWMKDEHATYQYIKQAERWMEIAKLRPKMEEMRDEIEGLVGQKEIGQEVLWQYEKWVDNVEGRPDRLTRYVNQYMQDRWGKAPHGIERMNGFILGLEATLKLGLSPLSAIGNLGQLATNTMAVLGPKYTGVGLRRLMNPTAAGAARRKLVLTDLGIAEQASKLEDVSSAREFFELYQPEELREVPRFGYALAKELALAMFQGMEYVNRAATALGSYDRAQSLGWSHAKSVEAARAIVNRTQFHYGPADAPHVLVATRTLAPAMQFKNFMLKELEFMWGLTQKQAGFRFDDRKKELTRFLIAILAVAGVDGIPGTENFDDIVEWATSQGETGVGLGFRPTEELKRRWPRISRGALGVIADVDITRAVGFSDWLTPREFTFRRLGGPFGSEVLGFMELMAAAPGRERAEALRKFWQNASPQMRRFYEAYKDREVRDSRGRAIVKDASNIERFKVALGATPTRIANEYDAYYTALEIKSLTASERGGYVDQIIAAKAQKNWGEAARLQAEAQRLGYTDMARKVSDREAYLRNTRLEGLKGRSSKKTLREIRKRGL